MAESPKGIVAIFSYLDQTCNAMKEIRDRDDFVGHEVLAPTSYHELEHAAGYGASPVRYFTLVGALTGMFTGFGMCLLLDYDWPIVVGGKTPGIYSLPAYVVFGFELMVLIGAIATIAGMLIMGRIPNPKGVIYDTRITDDKFAVFVPNATTDGPQAELLRKFGAEEVNAFG